jgi:hypothetical protein
LSAFDDPDFGVFTSRFVMQEREAILLVFHEDDGDWQFLTGTEEHPDEIAYVHLHHVLAWDPTVEPLADLPRGWKAWRHSVAEAWKREPIPPDQPTMED